MTIKSLISYQLLRFCVLFFVVHELFYVLVLLTYVIETLITLKLNNDFCLIMFFLTYENEINNKLFIKLLIVISHKLLRVVRLFYDFQINRMPLVYIRIRDFVVHNRATLLLHVTMSFFVNVHAKCDQC